MIRPSMSERAFQGCDAKCRADPCGYPAPCEMYPKERHAGCAMHGVPPAHFNPPPMFALREVDPYDGWMWDDERQDFIDYCHRVITEVYGTPFR